MVGVLLFWYINVDLFLFWYTNITTLISCENTLSVDCPSECMVLSILAHCNIQSLEGKLLPMKTESEYLMKYNFFWFF